MKHSIPVKFLAILLAACALVTCAFSAVGIAVLSQWNLYAYDYQHWQDTLREDKARDLAHKVLDRFVAVTYGNCSDEVLAKVGISYTDDQISDYTGMTRDSWLYNVCDLSGKELTGNFADSTYSASYIFQYTFLLSANYPVDTHEAAEQGEYMFPNTYWDGETYRELYYYMAPEHVVTVYMTSEAITEYRGWSMGLLEELFRLRYPAIAVLAVALLVFAVCMVYLICAAGKTSETSAPNPGALNRLPLDLYLAVAGAACAFLLWLTYQVVDSWAFSNGTLNLGAVILVAALLLVTSVIGIGFVFAVAAQAKMKKGYWWHHSFIGFVLDKVWYFLRGVGKAMAVLFSMLPVIWKWLLAGGAMGITTILATKQAVYDGEGLLILGALILVCACVVSYVAYCFGVILSGAKRMAEGTLSIKISTRFLTGSFARCAEYLNTLADVTTVAAKKQLKSERMKTELITNVSHDIKTPLTSIINYVDLLRRPHTPEEEAQYLDVLGRQSQRMKKLIEDLTEMSKATTGNLSVDIEVVDAAEAVNQALGEFADKLAMINVQPVFRQPEAPVKMRADGRLTWRVLSNLLSNIVKYALPNTRMYVDLMVLDGQVLISLKNISREELNVSAEELTERFVRGDQSRNTEGSGLGLNIAKSLMELQRGQLQLLVDGDLFKVTLVFLGA